MNVRTSTRRDPASSDHIVQFFDTDESRARHVAAFLAEGYAAGEPLIVIARAASWAGIVAHLSELGIDEQQASAEGMLVVKGADDMLRRLSRNGAPDPELFEENISRAVSMMASRGLRVRAYGEMVDILAQRADLAEAIALEGLWNELIRNLPVYLFCGYSAAHFVSSASHRALRDICLAHTGVHRHEHDPLAAWLLTAAHNAQPGAGPLH